MAVTLVAWSCGGGAEGEEEEEEEEEQQPQYGGTYTQALGANLTYFDEVAGSNYGGHSAVLTTKMTHNELLQGDWTRGPAGTNETEWINSGDNRLDMKAGCLADTWEIPEMGTVVFHIREGVYWQDKEPVNGRELTIDDIVWSLNRTLSAGYFKLFYPTMCATIEITADEEARTVTVTVPVDQWVNMITTIPDYNSIVAREVIETYGDMTNWENSVGTGPFILTDWVDNSQATFVRNPNYWETNPCGPGEGDQLPYLEELVWPVITEPSSVVAAFETGVIDSIAGINYNYAQPLLDDPDLAAAGVEWKMYQPDGTYAMFFRVDKEESPFSVKEVRQAMMLAIDTAAIRDNYYQGYAEIVSWPLVPTTAYMDAYCTLEELPEDVQALYGHDVEAAQALLDQTAYSEGFDCSVICYDTPTMMDILALVKSYLEDININMELGVTDQAVWSNLSSARNYGPYEILYTGSAGNGTYLKMLNFSGTNSYNKGYINDPRGSDPTIEAAYVAMAQYAGTDEEAMMEINKELMPYLLEQCYCIPMPSAKLFCLWWPWVKNFYAAMAVGYYNAGSALKYRWIDQDLKESMGY
jgi:peptide/nickel transport system substrate-binding protein